MSFKSALTGSESVLRTLPSNCRPYLILEVKIPSTTFIRADLIFESSNNEHSAVVEDESVIQIPSVFRIARQVNGLH